MIARLLIYSSPESLASHVGSGNANNPDTLYFKAGEKLGIAEARKIKDYFSLKPYSAKGRTVILEDASVMTAEAQNALLKTIEELPKEAVLILGANSNANFLPTVLSRCQVINLKDETGNQLKDNKYIKDIEKLLDSEIEERFAYVEKLKAKEEFLLALVEYFHQHLLNYPKFAAEALQAEKWAKQNVNIRATLEYLMLEMPARKC